MSQDEKGMKSAGKIAAAVSCSHHVESMAGSCWTDVA